MEIGADFGHSGITSEDMANRRLPLDSRHGICLFTSLYGVLNVVCSQLSLHKKITEIGGDFGHSGITSEDMANRKLPLDSQRQIGLFTSLYDVPIVVCGHSSLG